MVKELSLAILVPINIQVRDVFDSLRVIHS